MVVPLKLTQFYGHSVPRPRIYPDVKLSDHRVDPPTSVNDALLSWASEAPWSMGGLSFKRFRAQGKVEGNVRKLRAYEEEDEPKGVPVKESGKSADRFEKSRSSVKEASRSTGKQKQAEEELVEATPARKLRRVIVEERDEESPAFVPATEERTVRRGHLKVENVSGTLPSRSAAKKAARSPLKGSLVVQTPAVVPATGGRRKGKLFSASTRSVRGSTSFDSPSNLRFSGSPLSDVGRSTRSAKKVVSAERSPALLSKKPSQARRKVVMASDGDSSDSDGGLEECLKEKGRPLRRSTRHANLEGNPLSGSESD